MVLVRLLDRRYLLGPHADNLGDELLRGLLARPPSSASVGQPSRDAVSKRATAGMHGELSEVHGPRGSCQIQTDPTTARIKLRLNG